MIDQDETYSIGTFAAMTGLTDSAVRFYERSGLLTPQKTPSGYRYFTKHDAFRINSFRVLTLYGFTVSEAVEMLECAQDSEKFRAHLVDEHNTLRLEMAKLQDRLALVDRTLGVLSDSVSSSPQLIHYDDVFFARASHGSDFRIARENAEAIRAMYDCLGASCCERIISKADFDNDEPLTNPSYIIGIREKDLDRVQSPGVALEKLVMGKCLSYTRRATRAESALKSSYDVLFTYMEEHGYRLRGDILLVPAFLNLDGEGCDVETVIAPVC